MRTTRPHTRCGSDARIVLCSLGQLAQLCMIPCILRTPVHRLLAGVWLRSVLRIRALPVVWLRAAVFACVLLQAVPLASLVGVSIDALRRLRTLGLQHIGGLVKPASLHSLTRQGGRNLRMQVSVVPGTLQRIVPTSIDGRLVAVGMLVSGVLA